MSSGPWKPRACPYGDPNCTGRHGAANPVGERCPSATAQQYETMRRINRGNLARVQAIKLKSGCIDCGYNGHPEALQFDHRPDEVKSFTIARKMTNAWSALEAEIAKCDVRCANCHAIKTAERREEAA